MVQPRFIIGDEGWVKPLEVYMEKQVQTPGIWHWTLSFCYTEDSEQNIGKRMYAVFSEGEVSTLSMYEYDYLKGFGTFCATQNTNIYRFTLNLHGLMIMLVESFL